MYSSCKGVHPVQMYWNVLLIMEAVSSFALTFLVDIPAPVLRGIVH